MRKLLISTLVTLAVIVAPTSVLAYVQVLGEKDSVTGHGNEVDVNVGTIEQNKNGQLEINNRGKKIQVLTDKNTHIFEKPGGRKINPSDIKKEDRIATFNHSKDATGSADLILLKSASRSAELKHRRAIYGLVREINGNILVVSHPKKDNPRYQVEVTEATKIKVKGVAVPTIGNIKVGDRVSAVGELSGDLISAKFVHVIPGHAFGLLERVATRSATPSATPTASPSASP